VYDYFKNQSADGTVIGARVNPLSNLDNTLSGAIERMPVDYWYAALDPVKDRDLILSSTFSSDNANILDLAAWKRFKELWLNRLREEKKTTDFNSTWDKNLSDEYNKFGWYDLNQKRIFDTDLSPDKGTLNEIDRKMLYSFSLDSFSDRQQLFLYILRAEATVPSLGGKTKSLAGGRAVALVWRDPYPKGYNKIDKSWMAYYRDDKNHAKVSDKTTKTFYPEGWYKQDRTETFNRISPWYQVNKNEYDDKNNAFDEDPLSKFPRLNGYHEQKILFFKLLGD